MTLDALPPQDAVVVPSGQGAFLDVWGPLAKVPTLSVPVGVGEPGGPHRVTEGRALDLLDAFTWRVEDDLSAALVYTDHRLLRERTVFVGAPTALVLEWLFLGGRVGAVAFNYPLFDAWSERGGETIQLPDVARETPYHVVVRREGLPRIAGLAASSDALDAGGRGHDVLAAEALAADLPCVALHHAAAAREAGLPLDSHYFSELDALFTLGLDEQAAEYLHWYEGQGSDPRHPLRIARALTLSGRAAEAAEVARVVAADPELAAVAELELARALLVLGDAAAALEVLDRRLAAGTLPAEAWLGRGLALRELHARDGNPVGLGEAMRSFLEAAQVGGHHSAEALHYAAGLHSLAGDWVQAEAAAVTSLARRDDPGTRIQLIAALLGQGRTEEAQAERAALAERHPAHAAQVAPLFA